MSLTVCSTYQSVTLQGTNTSCHANYSAGLNQTILLSLSMVVISAMIGSGGLGDVVLKVSLNESPGFEGGLAVVILAMVLDKLLKI